MGDNKNPDDPLHEAADDVVRELKAKLAAAGIPVTPEVFRAALQELALDLDGQPVITNQMLFEQEILVALEPFKGMKLVDNTEGKVPDGCVTRAMVEEVLRPIWERIVNGGSPESRH